MAGETERDRGRRLWGENRQEDKAREGETAEEIKLEEGSG